MSRITRWMDRRLYADYADDWDAARFRAFVLRRCRPGDFLLDLGAGRGHLEAFDYRSAVRRVAGVDPDEAVLQNPQVHEARLLPLPSGVIPYDDATFDVVVAANVLEHVEDPHACFTEVRRVLKPGGTFLAKTTNRRHYVALAARATPHAFHAAYNKLRGREVRDTFPTVYGVNTPRDVRRQVEGARLRLEALETWEGRPEYLRLSGPTYLAGFAYERAVNAFAALGRFRAVIVFAAVRP
jgi:ubiquinone/menaquinone biosynthesis C-methylase UbiE